jgi:hypothetical protein
MGSAGGGIVVVGAGRYLVNSANLTIPQGVFLRGFWENLGEQISDDYTKLPCVLLLNPAYTVQIAGRDAGVRGVAIINSTLTAPPTTLRGALDGPNSFSGTGITVGTGTFNSASDFYLGYLFIMGFAQGIHINGNQERPRVEYIAMDCQAGYLSDGSSDAGSVGNMHCWPYYAAHLSVPLTFAISNCTNNGGLIRVTCAANTFVTGDVVVINGVTGTTEANNRWTVTVINNTTMDLQGSTFSNAYVSGGTVYSRAGHRTGPAFDFKGQGGGAMALFNFGSWGYDVGIKIESGEDYDNLIGCWSDNDLSANDPTTVGVWILNSAAVSVTNHFFSSQGVALKIDVAGRSVNRAFISDSRIFGTRTYTAQAVNGSAHFTNCTFGPAPIRTESTGGQVVLVNCDLSNGTTFSYGSQSAPRAYIVGCVGVTELQPTAPVDTAITQIARWSGPGRGTPANNDQINHSYYMMNSAGSMVEIQRNNHRISTVTAGSETSAFYISLINTGVFTDLYSWTVAQYQPLVGGINLGNSSAGNRWGTVFCGGVNANSPSIGVGYATGAGNTVTQITSRTTAVTINAVTGSIIMFSAAGSTTPASFTVNNSSVAASDLIILNTRGSASNLYNFVVSTVGAGLFVINFWTTGGTATDAPIISFAVIKGVTA